MKKVTVHVITLIVDGVMEDEQVTFSEMQAAMFYTNWLEEYPDDDVIHNSYVKELPIR